MLPVLVLIIAAAALLSLLAFLMLRPDPAGGNQPAAAGNSTEVKQVISGIPAETTETTAPAAVPEIQLKEVTVYFYPDSSELKDGETKKLENTAAFLISHPEMKVTIEGHCAFYGTKEGRMKISRLRAEMIRDYLISKGWKPEEAPEIKWYGASRPVTENPEEKDKNRRVEITVKSVN